MAGFFVIKFFQKKISQICSNRLTKTDQSDILRT